MALAVMIFLWNIFWSYRNEQRDLTGDPWEGRTLEWSIPSPPPLGNFIKRPLVTTIDQLWYEKQEGDGTIRTAEEEDDIYVSNPTAQPLMLAGALFVSSFGFIFGFPPLQWFGFASVIGMLALRSFTAGRTWTPYTPDELRAERRKGSQ